MHLFLYPPLLASVKIVVHEGDVFPVSWNEVNGLLCHSASEMLELDLEQALRLFCMVSGLSLAPTRAPKAKKKWALRLNLYGKTLPICFEPVLLGFWCDFVQTPPPPPSSANLALQFTAHTHWWIFLTAEFSPCRATHIPRVWTFKLTCTQKHHLLYILSSS